MSTDFQNPRASARGAVKGYKSQWERLFGFGYAVEAEVRNQDEALIRQMLDALTAPYDGVKLHGIQMAAITAARARLGEKT